MRKLMSVVVAAFVLTLGVAIAVDDPGGGSVCVDSSGLRINNNACPPT
jgi:hypothetical protein